MAGEPRNLQRFHTPEANRGSSTCSCRAASLAMANLNRAIGQIACWEANLINKTQSRDRSVVPLRAGRPRVLR